MVVNMAILFRRENILRLFHIFNHSMVVVGLITGKWWYWILSLAIWYIIGTLGISIGYHRYLAHQSFETNRWKAILFSLIGCLATGGSPIAWAGAHRMHHADPDGKLDPHSPHVIGALRSYLHIWDPLIIPRRFVRDLIRDPFQRFLHRKYFWILLIWATSLYYAGLEIGIFVYSVPAALAFHAFGHINSFGHKFGYRNFPTKDTSFNNWWVNILTCGEGWHNNHHKYPRSYRIGLRPNEPDIGAWVLEKLPIMDKVNFNFPTRSTVKNNGCGS